MIEIKICGITNTEDARVAAESGANAVGFIFHPASPRFVSPAKAKEIISALPDEICRVGVFVDLLAGEVLKIFDYCGLDIVQLQGDEPPDYCRLFPAESIIKTVTSDRRSEVLSEYNVRAFLVDARESGLYGGTGKHCDWKAAALIAHDHRLVLAGGLTPENLRDAIATVAPHAVDVNSGVEISPGKKDHAKIRRAVDILRRIPEVKGCFGVFQKGRQTK